jgi:AcrR family transcriptional regulator
MKKSINRMTVAYTGLVTITAERTSSRERILAEATRLFAEHGYEATSTRAIAEAVGLNIATIAYHVGSKADLYREVMQRAHRAQRELVTRAARELAGCDPTPQATMEAMRSFADAYLDFSVTHPEVSALWLRRWLSEGEDMASIEHEFAGPLASEVTAILSGVLDRAGLAPDLDVEMLVYTMVWTAHSFSRGGIIDPAGNRLGADDLLMLERFRRHLHALIDGLLMPPA